MAAEAPYTVTQERALVIVPKVTASMSMIGSSFIILDVLRDKKKRKKTYYNLMLGMSCSDIFGSFGLFLSSWPIPKSTGIYGASGTTDSCTFQGFIIQLNTGVPLYTLCLSIHYMLIIVYKWNDIRMKKAERWMHACVLAWVSGTAIAGLPLTLYNPANLWCWIASVPPVCGDDAHSDVQCVRGNNAWIYRYVFYFGPLWFAAFVITIAMAKVSYVTWVGERASRKYRPTTRTSTTANGRHHVDKTRNLTRQVFKQALLYVIAFYATYTTQTILRALQTAGVTYPAFGLFLATTIMGPLQGFLNAANYVRPRYAHHRARNPDSSKWRLVHTVVMITIGTRKKSAQVPKSDSDGANTGVEGGDAGLQELSNGGLRRRSSIHNNASETVIADEVEDAHVLDPGYVLQQGHSE